MCLKEIHSNSLCLFTWLLSVVTSSFFFLVKYILVLLSVHLTHFVLWCLQNALHTLSFSFAACRLQLIPVLSLSAFFGYLNFYPGRDSLVPDSWFTNVKTAANTLLLLASGNGCSSTLLIVSSTNTMLNRNLIFTLLLIFNLTLLFFALTSL